MTAAEYLILGAGLSGLSAAYHLKKEGCRDWFILERSERAGGLCRSIRYDGGFTFDHSIHILYSSDPYATGLIKTLLDGNMVIKKRESWVFSHDVFTPYPWQANTFGLPVDVVRECVMGVIQATYKKKEKTNSSNFEAWCHATFGEGIARHFMIPYNRKLWACDLKKMTDAWIKDRVMTPSLHEVIEGALRRQEKAFGPNSVFWYPEKGGIEALPKGFLRYLDQDKMAFDATAEKILWKEKKVVTTDRKEWKYNRLISSLPLPALLDKMEPRIPPRLRKASGRLEHNIVFAVNLSIRRDELSPYHWVYFPEEKYLFHRISFPKNFSAAMVPEGWNSITIEISASQGREASTGKDLIRKVIADLKKARIITNGDAVEVKSVLTLDPAYIIYNHTHRRDVDQLLAFLQENDMRSCGRFGAWEYFNMDHSILSGKEVVE